MALMVCGFLGRASAAPPTLYTVSLPAPQTQMVDIGIEVHDVSAETLDFVLPVWRPGRYVILDSASTVREVSATNGKGAALPVEKVNKSAWRVTTQGARTIRLSYRLYANSLGERTRHVDDSHAFLSGAAVFMMVEGRREAAARVKVDPPVGWKVASGLTPLRDDPFTLTAPNYDVLVDSPLEIGTHDVLKFTAGGKSHEIAIWGEADFKPDQLIADFAKIVEAEIAIFGSAPYDRYLFILHIGAGTTGGTEHLNSTVIQAARKALEDPESYLSLKSLVAHEMFHTWNVKQFRPSGIQPYDYHGENYTKLLWVAEGTTSYYDDFIPVRCGLAKPDKYLGIVSDIIDAMRNKPGELVQSLENSSYDAWIQFGRSWPDSVNSTVNFYSKGAMVSFLLDMDIRQRTDNQRSLDDVMRLLFERFPLDGPGYTPEDLQTLVEEVAGGEYEEFFARYVADAQPLPLEEVVEVVGLELVFEPAKDKKADEADSYDRDDNDDDEDKENGQDESDEGKESVATTKPARLKAYLGLNVSEQGGRAVVTSALSDGPAYRAGLVAGDEVVALNGRKFEAGELASRLEIFKPGEAIEIMYFRRDALRTIKITLDGKPDGKWKLRRVKEPTDEQKAGWQSWLGQPWPD